MICIYGLSKDLVVEAVDVGGYYLALDSVERVGPAELREGRIRIPKKTQTGACGTRRSGGGRSTALGP